MSGPLKTPAECGAIADQVIGQYVKDCGAYGHPESLRKVLEMLISKCALGMVTISSADVAQQVLLRTCLSAAEFEDRRKAKGH